MKPIYDLVNGIINYNNVIFKFDTEQLNIIFNKNYKFKLYDNNLYPVTKTPNNNTIDILQYLFYFSYKNVIYEFKNNDRNDFRKDNVIIKHRFHLEIIKDYPNAIYFPGHCKNTGVTAYLMKNPYWKINDTDYLMFCEGNILVKLDNIALEKIAEFEKNYNSNKKITFYKCFNNYIAGRVNFNHNSKNIQSIYIHQIITNFFGNGKGTNNLSIDHLNRDKLDNRYVNLKVVEREKQQNNSKGVIPGTKRERKYNAQELPDNIKQQDIPKYVYYCKEKYNKNGDTRDFFRIEKHPKQIDMISTTKSCKIDILTKLNEAKDIINKLENDTYYEKITKVMKLTKAMKINKVMK